jgi:hypothetical protein
MGWDDLFDFEEEKKVDEIFDLESDEWDTGSTADPTATIWTTGKSRSDVWTTGVPAPGRVAGGPLPDLNDVDDYDDFNDYDDYFDD